MFPQNPHPLSPSPKERGGQQIPQWKRHRDRKGIRWSLKLFRNYSVGDEVSSNEG